jgi:CheY-like chemotaxis protein
MSKESGGIEMGVTAELLLVEDNDGDARLTREALKAGRLWTHLNVVRDGAEAMAYLRREGKFIAAARPHLILLDLNLPRKDGREVLQEIKSDDDLKRIPVVVVTSSTAEEDIHLAYGAHANCYIPKPENLNEFVAVVEAIEHFWLSIVRLPSS